MVPGPADAWYVCRMEPEATIPIFPLPVVVLFPDGRAPLHIFEPRYRQMMEDALAGDGIIGMVTVPEEEQHGMGGDPAVFPVGCAGGRISQYQRLADGRYNLVLDAIHRFRILEEPARPASQLYRSARVEPLRENNPEADGEAIATIRREIMTALDELVRESGSGRELSDHELLAKSDAAFTNNLCQALTLPTVEKQGLLEADSLRIRAERLVGHLEFHLATVRTGGPKRTVH